MERTEAGPFTALAPAAPAPDAPVVALMGWAGAGDRALGKYAALLAARGFPTVRSALPLGRLFAPSEAPRRAWAAALADFLADAVGVPPRRVVLYAFSNGGGFVVEQLSLLAATERYSWLGPAVAGVVFDSAPGYMSAALAARVADEASPPGSWRRAALRARLAASRVLTPLLTGDRPRLYWARMRALAFGAAPPPPLLFLYSADAPLCDAARLEALIGEHRAAGRRVRAVRWAVSKHVGHLARHRAEYEAALLGFLAEAAGGAPRPRL
jgi:dienelactone hydrolase